MLSTGEGRRRIRPGPGRLGFGLPVAADLLPRDRMLEGLEMVTFSMCGIDNSDQVLELSRGILRKFMILVVVLF